MVLPAANFSTSSTNGSMSPSSNCSEPIAGQPNANAFASFNTSADALATSRTFAWPPAAWIPSATAPAIISVLPVPLQ